jgi:hypothetical protein
LSPSRSIEQFLAQPAPPEKPGAALRALWWAHNGDWDKAHAIVMEADDRDAAWVHAYLHRVEGDLGNAAYWYRQAGRPAASGPIEAEWRAIVVALLCDDA